ncbi:MAG: 1-acyl-sn-glycerol-3-phosphate acyltransferase [Rhodobacteraceae bacterium]|jgi:1-acyl-sn-glycerol-3-phosphate acyltransferase|nr:1-acyl-sn-glycerol-3-phosphate acyltransferase [Paracoccaceae bacterium]
MRPWQDVPMAHPRLGPGSWLRVVLRGLVLGLVTYGCLILLLVVRLVEWPLFGQARPVTPYITQFVCRAAFVILRLPLQVKGKPMQGVGAIVANHSSWLDIFALNAADRVYFVAKSEVAGWPGIGILARATGTEFIRRKTTEARRHQEQFENRLLSGHRLLFFPEGTSTDAIRVLPFKSTLFAAFMTDHLKNDLSIQPVTVVYHAPFGHDARHYGWWGDMDFAPHLLITLAARRQGRVDVVFHPPLRVADFPDRKALAAACEAAVRSAHPNGQ